MPLPIQFPNVPNLPGVPQVARSLSFPADPTPSLGSGAPQSTLWQSASGKPAWGIFDSKGKLALDVDNIINLDNRSEFRVATFPIQNGGFGAYDKVNVPFELAVRVTKGKTKTLRKQFLSTLDTIAQSLELYTILTPERSYTNCNINRYEVSRRGPSGAYFLGEVDIYFMNIREVTAQYSDTSAATQNAQDPSAQPPTNNGLVQGVQPSPAAATGAQEAITQAPQ